MKKITTTLVTVAILALVAAMPATARTPDGAPDAQARMEQSQPITVVKATGILRRGVTFSPYVVHRIFDTRTGRFYALTSIRHRVPLDRYVGQRVTVHGTGVLGFPRYLEAPLLDVFRVVPLARSSSD